MLRRRIPDRYRSVCGRTGTAVKITTGTADRKAADKAWPAILERWNALLAEWERALNVVALAPDRAGAIAAGWAAWIAGAAELETDGATASDFEDYTPGAPVHVRPHAMARLEYHADEALRLAGTGITPRLGRCC
jgi:hypothetical protein